MVITSFLGSWIITESVKSPEDEMIELCNAHAKPCMDYWTTDTAFKDTISLEAQAMQLFNKGDYNLAIEAFQHFEPQEKDEAMYNLYLGYSYLKTGFTNLAILHFEESANTFKKFDLIQLSRWYLAMAYLNKGDKENAVQTLKGIIEINAPQRYAAIDILKQIDVSNNPIKSLRLLVGL
jgi:tetratricopeptide (TPR) repeat protein